MKRSIFFLTLITACVNICAQPPSAGDKFYQDREFSQEYHEPYPINGPAEQNNVRSIAVDAHNTVWIATETGVLFRSENDTLWTPLALAAEDAGPAFVVVLDAATGDVLIGHWKGVLRVHDGKPSVITGTNGPVSVLCLAKEGVYAIGPKGVWCLNGDAFTAKSYLIARSVRSAISDGSGGIWAASDVGLYHCTNKGVEYFQQPDVLLSASLKGLAFDSRGALWVAGLGGITVLDNGKRRQVIRPQEGCPSIHINAVRHSPDSSMWVGTEAGIVRYASDGSHSLRFSRRWLLDDHVNDIAFDGSGNAWIATQNGVSAIKKRKMTLASKADYFYDVLMRRHIREPWIAGQCHLNIAGDTTSWQPEDDDNDGEYGGNYLAMESFRYAVTKNEDARQKAAKSFAFLKKLKEITGGDGYFARTIVPISWGDRVHDVNRTFTPQQLADELVKEPRFKPVETRWRKSADGQWLWKGDASSDEWCGHMMGYYFYYELVADKQEKAVVRAHVASLVDHLIAHDYNMVDIDGTHARWSVWSPTMLNNDPEWRPDQSENSMELLAFLKLAFYMTGKQKYQQQYLRLIREEHYLDNVARLTEQNPGWFIYFDVMMQSYLYPILIRCETDPSLKAWYQQHMDNWMKFRKGDHNPQINFFYDFTREKQEQLDPSIEFLIDTPLDLVSWSIDHTRREDIRLVHEPVLDDLEVSELPQASIRATVRWDSNPWTAVNGNPNIEREPVFWLLPYWLGRYLSLIK